MIYPLIMGGSFHSYVNVYQRVESFTIANDLKYYFVSKSVDPNPSTELSASHD